MLLLNFGPALNFQILSVKWSSWILINYASFWNWVVLMVLAVWDVTLQAGKGAQKSGVPGQSLCAQWGSWIFGKTSSNTNFTKPNNNNSCLRRDKAILLAEPKFVSPDTFFATYGFFSMKSVFICRQMPIDAFYFGKDFLVCKTRFPFADKCSILFSFDWHLLFFPDYVFLEQHWCDSGTAWRRPGLRVACFAMHW